MLRAGLVGLERGVGARRVGAGDAGGAAQEDEGGPLVRLARVVGAAPTITSA